MAIDEIAIREGQNYMTIVVDLDSVHETQFKLAGA